MFKNDLFGDYVKKEAVNASLLKDLRKSPLNAFGVEVVKESSAMTAGKMYHSFILEPDTFKDHYYAYDENERPVPESTFAKTENKEWKAGKMKEAGDRQLISRAEIEQFVTMRNILRTHIDPRIINLIGVSQKEMSLYHDLPVEGVGSIPVKCRFDAISVERGAIFDLKTTANATPDGFTREAGKFAYHVQAAFYLRVAEDYFKRPFKFFFLTQETAIPFNALAREVSPGMRQKGDYEIDRLLPAVDHIMKTGEIQSYDVFTDDALGIVPLDIPQYFVMDHEFNFKTKSIA